MTMTDERDALVARFGAHVDLAIGGLAAAHASSTTALTRAIRRGPMQPAHHREVTSKAYPASGTVSIMHLRGPNQGHVWYVRSVAVSGLTPTTTTAGRADLYVSSANLRVLTDITQLGAADWRDQQATLPGVGFYSRGQLTIVAGENLWVVITSGTASQQYIASATIEDVEEGNDSQGFAL